MIRVEGSPAEVAVLNALEKTLHYKIPPELTDAARVGSRVLVPLGRREALGVILSLQDTGGRPAENIKLRPVVAVLDREPLLTRELIDLCRWISSYYFHPLGDVLQTAMPPGTTTSPEVFFRLTPAGEEAVASGDPSPILCLLREKKSVSAADILDEAAVERLNFASPPPSKMENAESLLKRNPADGSHALDEKTPDSRSGKERNQKTLRNLRALERKGFIERSYKWRLDRPGALKIRMASLEALPEREKIEANENLRDLVNLLMGVEEGRPLREIRKGVVNADYWVKKLQREGFLRIREVEAPCETRFAQEIPDAPPPPLTPDQTSVFESVRHLISRPSFKPFLLHGVTGSGKTEVYLRLVERCVEEDRGALALVPEIALSTQMEAVFRSRFGDRMVVWHSALPQRARLEAWSRVASGERRIVLGARSAVFMPIRDLGLILVDEEHDSSYKQDDHLRYSARDVAIVRAKMLGVPIVLGSATPSLQTIRQCRTNRYGLLSLPARVFDRPHPEIEVVDMRRESTRTRIISTRLEKALKDAIENGEQALLFLNRRGFATFFICNVCGRALQCPSCSVTLTYHLKEGRLRCHYCGSQRAKPSQCPECGSSALVARGFGTERLESEVRRMLPDARIVRIDRDTTTNARDLVTSLNAIRSGHADILIGTQMVAKGHDFPGITLVGVVNADTALQLPDYRSGEITVQLLMQVAGRAGRGESPGRVILQTYNPGHHTVESVCKLDYEGFCDIELESRQKLQYPPFTRFLRFLVTFPDESFTQRAATALAHLCRAVAGELRMSGKHIAVLGPSPAPLVKLKNRYRWQVFAKSTSNRDMSEFTEAVLARAKERPELRRVELAVDRDPLMSM